MKPVLNEFSLNFSAARNETEAAITLVLDEYAFDDTNPHGAIFTFTDTIAINKGLYPMAFTGLTYSDAERGTLMAVSEGGDVQIFTGEDVLSDGIDDIRGPLRDIVTVAGNVYVCGGNHQVLRRIDLENWEDISPDATLREDMPHNHFEQIDGYSADELYTAGRDGIIWWYNGISWTAVQSTTNLAFLCVDCAPDGTVYLGGQGGIVAKGRHDAFTVYSPETPLADIWGIAEFEGTLYTAMSNALMTWDAEAGHQPEAPAMELAETFYNLERAGSALWSMGMKDVLRLKGEAWERITDLDVKVE